MRRPFHPILFGLYPVLALYSLNTSLIPIGDIVLPALLVLGATLAVWGVLAVVLRSATRAANGASVAVVWVFAYGHIWDFVQRDGRWRTFFYDKNSMTSHLPRRAKNEAISSYWAGVLVLALLVACWKWKKADQVMPAMNIGGIVLAGVPILSIGASLFSAWRGTQVRAVGSNAAKLDTSVRPDIYYIILDGYGRSDALKRVIGVSNDWFINALEARGFFVPREARSNYCETELSLASSLNMDYLSKLLPNLDQATVERFPLDSLIDKNGVSRYLRKIGYRYEAMTSGFPAVHPYSADIWLQDTKGVSLFAGALLEEMPATEGTRYEGMSQFTARRIMLKSALQNAVQSKAGVDIPKFVFVHVLAPHPPFVFGADGQEIRPKKMGFSLVDGNHFYENGGTPAEYASGYAGQATYISKLVLSAVDQILKRSSQQPVIIIQGDHGSKLKLDQEFVEKTDLNECFPNLNAYLVPKSVRVNLYDSITPVNSFRMLFNGLFHDRFPLLPDRSFYSAWSKPFQFIEVTSKIKKRSSSEPVLSPSAHN